MRTTVAPTPDSDTRLSVGYQPTSALVYDGGFPPGVSAPSQRIQTQGDPIGTSARDDPEANVDISRYIDQAVGGKTGVVVGQGYSGGLSRDWFAGPFTGRYVRFFRRNLSNDKGPVGLDNRASALQAGVAEQFTVPPTLEQIYQGFVGGGVNNGG